MSGPFSLPLGNQVPLGITFQDTNGIPASVTGITFIIDHPEVLSVIPDTLDATVSEASLIVTLVARAAGDANLTVSGVNPDGTPVTGVFAVTIPAAAILPAVSVVFTPGVPVPIQ